MCHLMSCSHAPYQQKKTRAIGEKIYPLVLKTLEDQQQPENLAGKVTGMLLDGVPNDELMNLVYSPKQLRSKVEEATTLLKVVGYKAGDK